MMYTIRTGKSTSPGDSFRIQRCCGKPPGTLRPGGVKERHQQEIPDSHAGLNCVNRVQAAERGAIEIRKSEPVARDCQTSTPVVNRGVIRRAGSLLFVAASLFAGVATAQQTITGVSGGALYKLIVPNPWNGQLVIYAHGAVDAGTPLALPNSPLELAAFQAISSQGFAIAMSSFGETGWA